MSKASNRPEPQLAHTDFESMTHEQLAAMLDSASTAGASHLSTKLAKAATTITKIGDDLMQHVKNLEWQGDAGDAFRDWGGQTASATLRLGEYAAVASRWMGTVSQAISEAKAAMPDVSETTQAKTDLANAHATIAAAKQPGAHNDPDAQQQARTAKADATAAQQRIEAARGEAIQQMRKLAQTYEYSAQQVNSVTPPTFSPPASHLEPDWYGDSSRHISVGSDGSTTASRTHTTRTSGGTVSAPSRGPQGTVPHAVTQTVSNHGTPVHTNQPIPHTQPVDMRIDGTDTLPRTAPSQTTTGPHTGMPHPESPVPSWQPSVLPPVYTGGERMTGPAPGPRDSSPSRLSQPTPGGLATGRGPTALPPGGVANGRTPQLPRETGIVGGRPVATPSGRPQNGIPRGTVIGSEGGQGRTGMMPGGTVQGSGAGSAGSVRGTAGGRRLAFETGGVVGNRQVQPERTGGRPFTSGGSGLVRPAPVAAEGTRAGAAGRKGSTSHAERPTGSRKEQQRGRRPDYLCEDEETWTPDNQRMLPPVVD
ncbi:WXG100 family type VII secretion target [Streptomyces sp. NPDC001606]